jgi:hypothetical protein
LPRQNMPVVKQWFFLSKIRLFAGLRKHNTMYGLAAF